MIHAVNIYLNEIPRAEGKDRSGDSERNVLEKIKMKKINGCFLEREKL